MKLQKNKQAKSYLSEVLVLSFHARVDWTLQRFQIRDLRLNLLELVSAVNIVDRTDQALDVVQHPFNLRKLVGVTHIIYWTTEVLDLDQVLLNFIEFVVSLNRVDRIVQGLDVE